MGFNSVFPLGIGVLEGRSRTKNILSRQDNPSISDRRSKIVVLSSRNEYTFRLSQDSRNSLADCRYGGKDFVWWREKSLSTLRKVRWGILLQGLRGS